MARATKTVWSGQDFDQAESIRVRVALVLLGMLVGFTLVFLGSYILTGEFGLIPYLLPFLLPPAAVGYLLYKSGDYRLIVGFLAYFYTVMGLMNLVSTPDYLVDLFLMPVLIGVAFLSLKPRHALIMVCYTLCLYGATAGIVYLYEPFEVLYTNDNRSSVILGFFMSVAAATYIYYYFSVIYQRNSRMLGDAMVALQKVNDDNKLLISVISHDFRNYLSNVLLNVEYSKLKCSEASQLQCLESIEASMFKLSELLSEAQKVRELFNNEDESQTSDVSFRAVMQKIRLVYKHQMFMKSLSFELHGCEDLQLKVNPDIFIHLIMGNLIGNAIKFSPPGAGIRIGLEQLDGKPAVTIENVATADQDANLLRLARGEAPLASQPGTGNEAGQGMGVGIVKRFCKLLNISHVVSVQPDTAEGLRKVQTRLVFNQT